MNRDDIIRMAREANGDDAWDGGVEWVWAEVERFAALVEAAVIARLPGRGYYHEGYEAGAAAEREACAKVLDEMAEKDKLSNYYQVAALAIRARGQG